MSNYQPTSLKNTSRFKKGDLVEALVSFHGCVSTVKKGSIGRVEYLPRITRFKPGCNVRFSNGICIFVFDDELKEAPSCQE